MGGATSRPCARAGDGPGRRPPAMPFCRRRAGVWGPRPRGAHARGCAAAGRARCGLAAPGARARARPVLHGAHATAPRVRMHARPGDPHGPTHTRAHARAFEMHTIHNTRCRRRGAWAMPPARAPPRPFEARECVQRVRGQGRRGGERLVQSLGAPAGSAWPAGHWPRAHRRPPQVPGGGAPQRKGLCGQWKWASGRVCGALVAPPCRGAPGCAQQARALHCTHRDSAPCPHTARAPPRPRR